MTLPAFSVVIPAFERRHTIERALSSVFAQRHPADEIILVDDGSKDGTSAFVRKKFPGVRLIRLEVNQGPAVARNAGIRCAGHSHLAFLDSDDAWHEDYLAAVAETWRAHPEAGIVYTQYDKIEDRPGGRVDAMDVRVEGDQIEAMLRNNFIHSCSLMSTRRDWTLEVGGFDPAYRIGEDRAMYLRLLLRGPAIAVPARLVRRHVADDNLINDLEGWWRDATAIVARFTADPAFAAYRHVEDESRARVFEAIGWHDRQRERARRERQRRAVFQAPVPAAEPVPPSGRNEGPAVHLFLHAGGLPIEALTALLEATGLFGRPAPWFDHDGPMLEAVRAFNVPDLDGYLDALLAEATSAGRPFSALIGDRDLAWLKSTPAFARLLRDQEVRIVRLFSQDRVLQACQRATDGRQNAPTYDDIADALVAIEQADASFDRWLSGAGLDARTLRLEDLETAGLPTLRALAPGTDMRVCPPLAPLGAEEIALAGRFREEARLRNWVHALAPVGSLSRPVSA